MADELENGSVEAVAETAETETVEVAPEEVAEDVQTIEVEGETEDGKSDAGEADEVPDGEEEELKADDGAEGEEEEEEETVEAKKEGEDEEEEEEEEEELELELITFEDDEELPTVLEKIDKLAEKWDIPEEVANAFAVLKARAENNTIEAFADYGDKEKITADLEFVNNLTSSRTEGDKIRPNTDLFVKDLIDNNHEEKVSWVQYELLGQPSKKYPGISRLEEIECDALAVEGDTIGSVISRMKAWKEAVLTDAQLPEADIPKWVTPELHATFRSLDKESRQELIDADWEPEEYEADERKVNAKLSELNAIEKGRQAELKEMADREAKVKAEAQALVDKTNDRVLTFFSEFREQGKKQLETTLEMTPLEAAQRVMLVERAFDEDSGGEFARKSLEAQNIKFDVDKAKQLQNSIQAASADLTEAERFTNDKGEPINPVAVNKAVKAVAQAVEEWQKFADGLIHQMNTKQSTQSQLKAKAKEKQKILPKARAVAKTAKTNATPKKKSPPMFSQEYYEREAEEQIAEMKKVQQYI